MKNKAKGSFVLVLLIAFAFLSNPVFAGNDDRVQITNFGKIADTYYRGGQPKGDDFADLAAMGIKTVINLIGDDVDRAEKSYAKKSAMNYFHIPMTTHKIPTSEELSLFLGIVNDPANQPVYVHCVEGKHRTGVMTAVYRMTQHGWNADQAYQEMKKYKFGPSLFHPEFKKFVYSFYGQLMAQKASLPVTITSSN